MIPHITQNIFQLLKQGIHTSTLLSLDCVRTTWAKSPFLPIYNQLNHVLSRTLKLMGGQKDEWMDPMDGRNYLHFNKNHKYTTLTS